MNLGYACINTELRKKKVFAGRTCRKAKFDAHGLRYVGDLGVQNLKDLLTILRWNRANGISFYRIGSDIFPWSSEYEYSDLPQYSEVVRLCKEIGDFATANGQRLTFHPGPFNILGSSNENVVQRTMVDLRHHSELFDLMGFTPSPYNKINIHIGAAYKDKFKVLDRWCENYTKLDPNTRKRLTVENDDKTSLYHTQDLYDYVHKRVGIPIVFDFHHHGCHPGDLTRQEALGLAVSTWPDGIKPVVHFSSSRRIEESKAKLQAHADFIHSTIDTYGYDVDVMLEAKAKEQALLRYRKTFLIL